MLASDLFSNLAESWLATMALAPEFDAVRWAGVGLGLGLELLR